MDADTKPEHEPRWEIAANLLIGVFFGMVLIKSEAVSWYRIQEMFRFQGFHMYGILATAAASSSLAIFLFRALGVRSLKGRTIRVAPKPWGTGARHRYWIGGTLFGLGWGLLGTCPGPIYALIGYGSGAAVIALFSALVGARSYAALAHKLPH